MAAPLMGLGVMTAVRFIMKKGLAEASKKFSPKIITAAKKFINKSDTAKDMIKKGVKKVKSKKKTEKDFEGTPLGGTKPKINYDSVKPKTYSYRHLDKYTRG